MEKSIIVLFIKFFDQCIISKMIKRAKIFINILSMVLIVFSWIVFNIALIEITKDIYINNMDGKLSVDHIEWLHKHSIGI